MTEPDIHDDWPEHGSETEPTKEPIMKNPLTNEPTMVAAALVAVLNVLVLLEAITLDTDQLSAINAAVVLVLGLFVRSQVTPVAKV